MRYNIFMIMKLWVYFKSKHIKTELFFITSLASVLLFYPSFKAMVLCAFFIPAVFGGLKRGVPAGIIAALLAWVLSSNVMITEIKRNDGKNWLYNSTWGSVVAQPHLKPGDIITGQYHKKVYSFIKEGRFAKGYFIFDRVDSIKSYAPAAKLLQKRADLSDELFYRSGGEAYLTQALTLGDRRYMPPDVQDMFIMTGLGHLLSVSGMHAGIFAGIMFFLFSFLPGKIRLIPMMLSMLFLMPLTGFTVTVIRSALFVFFVMAAQFFDYRTDVRKLVLFLAGYFMLITPSMAGDISFILSFSAVYGIVYLTYEKMSPMVMSVFVGLVASACIMPAAAAVFGTFNVTSVISTIILTPVVAMQMAVFMIYTVFPEYSVQPILLLDKVHMYIVRFFSDHSEMFYKIYKPDDYVIAAMVVFILYCMYRRRIQAVCVLLLLPHLPGQPMAHVMTKVKDAKGHVQIVEKALPAVPGIYFPKMIRSKGFAQVDTSVHVFYKGTYGDFKYKFLPYLQKKNINKADDGNIIIYNGENYLFKVDKETETFKGICINETRPDCKVIFHTRSHTYRCDDDKRLHILYNNRKKCENMLLLKTEGDIILDENTYKRR